MTRNELLLHDEDEKPLRLVYFHLKTILKYSRQEVNQINLSLIDKSANIVLESDHALIDVDLRIVSYC